MEVHDFFFNMEMDYMAQKDDLSILDEPEEILEQYYDYWDL